MSEGTQIPRRLFENTRFLISKLKWAPREGKIVALPILHINQHIYFPSISQNRCSVSSNRDFFKIVTHSPQNLLHYPDFLHSMRGSKNQEASSQITRNLELSTWSDCFLCPLQALHPQRLFQVPIPQFGLTAPTNCARFHNLAR